MADDLALGNIIGVFLGNLANLKPISLLDLSLGLLLRKSEEVRDALGVAAAKDASNCSNNKANNNDRGNCSSNGNLLVAAAACLVLVFFLCCLCCTLGAGCRQGSYDLRFVAACHPGSGSNASHKLGGILHRTETPSKIIAQRASKLVGALEAIGWILLHALEDDAFEASVDLRVDLAWRDRLLIDLLKCDGDGVVALKGDLARCGLVHNNAQRVDIGGRPELFALRLFRGDVVCGTKHRVVGGEMAVLGASDTEVHHLDVAVGLHHDVLRLDVAVDDVVAVGYRKGLCDLQANLSYLAPIESTMLADPALKVGSA